MGDGQTTPKKSMYIPRRWRRKCRRDYHWCTQLSDSLTVAEKMEKLNCGHKLGRVYPDFFPMYQADCKKECPNDETKQDECFIATILLLQTLRYKWYGCHVRKAKHDIALPDQRAGNLTPDKSSSGLSICLALGAIFSLILVGVLLYCFFFREQKQTSGGKAKGSSSKGASQMGKSKLGKSKLGSRKSSQRSSRKASKRSKGAKSRLSAKK